MMDFIKSHWLDFAALGYAVLNFLNAVRPKSDNLFWKLIDRVSVLVPKDSPNTVKPPLLGSKDPE